MNPQTAVNWATSLTVIVSVLLFLGALFGDPDIFLGILNIFAGITTAMWLHFTINGGGNDNAVTMFCVVFAINCCGVCAVFIRRRRLAAKGLLVTALDDDSDSEEECDKKPVDNSSKTRSGIKKKKQK
mmetsp:Transcript_8730/g.13042  ORF Transcript_8730/g.13042 Transcript_8730/m.13042 type:complete len:128 (+) Transcript_8730:34-417(+)